MTAKEKAKELVEKFDNLFAGFGFDMAKDAALIAVDELLSLVPWLGFFADETKDFLMEVKQEIENL